MMEKEFIVGNKSAIKHHYSHIAGEKVTIYDPKVLGYPLEGHIKVQDRLGGIWTIHSSDLLDSSLPSTIEFLKVFHPYPFRFGEGFLQKGVEVKIGDSRASQGGYISIVGKKGFITGANNSLGTQISVILTSEMRNGWWVFASDCLPISYDNEGMYTILREEDKNECNLPRIL